MEILYYYILAGGIIMSLIDISKVITDLDINLWMLSGLIM